MRSAAAGRQLCRAGPAFTIAAMADAVGAPTANFTHHFLIAMPAMADPHFAHTLTYVCEHNEDGALGIVVNKPIDMTLSALFEQIDVPLADADAARARRSISAARCRSTAASCCTGRSATGSRRSPSTTIGPHDVEGRARSGRPRRGPEGRVRVAGLRGLVGRASSSRRSRRTRGSRSQPIPTCCSTLPAEAAAARGDAPARHRFLAPVRRRRARVTCGAHAATPDAHGARVRFRHAPHRRRGRQYAARASRIR